MTILPLIFWKTLLLNLVILSSGLSDPGDKATPNFKEGYVLDMGDESDGGCGYLLSIDGKYFKPRNLAEIYQKDSLKVKLDVDFSMSLYKCASVGEEMQEIIINWIEPVREPEDAAQEETP